MSHKNLYNDKYCKNVHDNVLLKKYSDRLRLKQILKFIEFNPDDKVLEIGANTGKFTKEIGKYSPDIIGIDFNKNAIEIANRPNIILMNAEDLKFPDNSFDKIISIHVIEHIPNIEKAFSEISRVLKHDGQVFLIYPFELVRGFNAIPDAIRIHKNPLIARKLHLHKVTPKKIKKMIAGTDLKIEKSGFFFGLDPSFYTLLKKTK